MEDTKRKVEVMEAYVEGKKIQVKDCGVSEWRDCTMEPDLDWVSGDYRVKPEAEYRPYHSYHEMVDDFCERFNANCPAYEMPCIWVKQKDTDYVHFISAFQCKDEVRMENYFQNNTYLDGSTVGKKVEDEKAM